MTSTFTPADTLHRLVKEALDSGAAASLAEAEAMFRSFDLSFDIGEMEARDPFHQAALLTGVALGGPSIFHGGSVAGLLKDREVAWTMATLVAVSSVLALHLMNIYQPRVSPSIASVVYCTEPLFGNEFGRLPTAQGQDGRDHNINGCPMFLAGAGVKKGFTCGATDEYGYYAVENKVTVHDLHATALHLLGLDHTRLTFPFGGREMRLTDVHGVVVKEILS